MKSKESKGVFDYADKLLNYKGPQLVINERYFKTPKDLIK